MVIPRGKLGAVSTEKGEQVRGCWNTDSQYVAICGLWHSVLLGSEGSFLHGGSQESLTTHPEEKGTKKYTSSL